MVVCGYYVAVSEVRLELLSISLLALALALLTHGQNVLTTHFLYVGISNT